MSTHPAQSHVCSKIRLIILGGKWRGRRLLPSLALRRGLGPALPLRPQDSEKPKKPTHQLPNPQISQLTTQITKQLPKQLPN